MQALADFIDDTDRRAFSCTTDSEGDVNGSQLILFAMCSSYATQGMIAAKNEVIRLAHIDLRLHSAKRKTRERESKGN